MRVDPLFSQLAIYGGGRFARGIRGARGPNYDAQGFNRLRPLLPFANDDRYSWFGRVFPDTANVSLPARTSFEDQITITPGSWLLTVSAFSEQAEGFRFQVSDKAMQKEIYSAYVSHSAGAGVINVGQLQPPQFILPAPWLVAGNGLLSVQLSNLSPNPNYCQLMLQFAVPKPGKVNC